jgi:short subunit fatty acids transporter
LQFIKILSNFTMLGIVLHDATDPEKSYACEIVAGVKSTICVVFQREFGVEKESEGGMG